MSTPTERRYRREARYSKQLRVTVEPATAAALEAEADAAQTSVSAVIRDALARGLPLAREARRKRQRGPRHAGGARDGAQTLTGLDRVATTTRTPGEGVRADNDPVQPAAVKTLLGNRGRE